MYEQRLLAIEDDEQIARLINKVAIEAGFDARILSKTDDIARVYAEFQPEAIILDILMPGLDGFDILNFLRDKQSRAQIVILSGSHHYRGMAEKLGEAHGLNVVANLAKPFRVVELRLALQEVRLNMRDIQLPYRVGQQQRY